MHVETRGAEDMLLWPCQDICSGEAIMECEWISL